VILGALHFAVMRNDELVEHGVPAHVVTSERERLTGHVRRVQPRWALAIGYWGGVATLREIAEHVGVDIAAAREYAKFRGLRWRTKRRVYTPAQLAVLALVTPGSARDAAPKLGVLPIEVCMCRAAITEVLVHHTTTLSALLHWSPNELERAWRDLGVRIEAPEPERRSITEPGYLERIVANAERWVAQHPEEEP